ncbi:hypothetical protein V6N12_071234 [Hibiscus sabdariffa]|uniref:Uncharacterized protein n=1 Tax=Hibiscus sabdariffa TaxID=183260 RepID=A0ABR2FJF4_9ROSI
MPHLPQDPQLIQQLTPLRFVASKPKVSQDVQDVVAPEEAEGSESAKVHYDVCSPSRVESTHHIQFTSRVDSLRKSRSTVEGSYGFQRKRRTLSFKRLYLPPGSFRSGSSIPGFEDGVSKRSKVSKIPEITRKRGGELSINSLSRALMKKKDGGSRVWSLCPRVSSSFSAVRMSEVNPQLSKVESKKSTFPSEVEVYKSGRNCSSRIRNGGL